MSAYLTLAAIAEELDVHMRTVSRWIAAGELEAIRLPGGQLRIPQSAYTEFLRSHQAVPGPRTFVDVDEQEAI